MPMKKAIVDPLRIVNPDPQSAIVYIRVSKGLDLQELGVSAQLASCRAWAARNNIKILHVVEDEISGGKPLAKRKLLHHALGLMREMNAGKMLCSKVDRFGRNMVEALKAVELIQARGGTLVFSEGPSPGDPNGDIMFKMFLLFAEHELKMIQARTSDARRVLISRGLYPGGQVPFGYDRVKLSDDPKAPWYLRVNEQEQAGLRRVRELRKKGYSWTGCARIVAKEGLLVSNRNGENNKPVSHASLWKLLRKELGNLPLVPFGMRVVDGQLEEDPEEQSVLAMMLHLSRKGVGVHPIVKILREQGVLTRAARPPSWHWVQKQLAAMAAPETPPE